jgi:2'-5' RNA ligase
VTRQHRLFFAVRPDARAVQAICKARQGACEQHGLSSREVAEERLHVTLHWMQDHAGELPPDLLGAALTSGHRLVAEPFDVVFDHLGSIGDVDSPGPLVLTGGTGLAALRRFQRALGEEMSAAGIGQYVRSSFRPHVSLLYTNVYLVRESILPVAWCVDELLLIDSHVGESVHEILGRWPLERRQAGFADW